MNSSVNSHLLYHFIKTNLTVKPIQALKDLYWKLCWFKCILYCVNLKNIYNTFSFKNHQARTFYETSTKHCRIINIKCFCKEISPLSYFHFASRICSSLIPKQPYIVSCSLHETRYGRAIFLIVVLTQVSFIALPSVRIQTAELCCIF